MSEKLITTNLISEDIQPAGESSTMQTCSTSFCLKDVGEFESTMQEREEIGLDLLPKTCSQLASNQCSEMGIEVTVSVEGCGYVPDSPTSSSGENPGGGDDPQQIDANMTLEDVSCKNSEGIEGKTETKGDNAKCEEINTVKGEDNDDHQKSELSEDGKKNDSRESNTCKEEALVGEDCRVVDATYGVDTRKDKDCQEGNPDIVAECQLSCQESSLQNSKNTGINADEKSMIQHGAGLKREEPSTKIEVYYQKRRKILQPDGERRHTRSSSRESSS